jgi:hypothetical protein
LLRDPVLLRDGRHHAYPRSTGDEPAPGSYAHRHSGNEEEVQEGEEGQRQRSQEVQEEEVAAQDSGIAPI